MARGQKTNLTIARLDPADDAADRFTADELAWRVQDQMMQGRASWQKTREPGERVLPHSLLVEAHQRAEDVLKASGVRVRHVAGERSWYSLERDEIAIPEQAPSLTQPQAARPERLLQPSGGPSR